MACAACGNGFTIYVSSDGGLLLCYNLELIGFNLGNDFVACYAGLTEAGAVTKSVEVYFFGIHDQSGGISKHNFESGIQFVTSKLFFLITTGQSEVES